MKLLFIKLGAIGDAIQAAAAVKEFRRKNPEAEVDWVAGTGIKALIELLGVADKVLEVDDRNLLGPSLFRRSIAFSRCVAMLAAQKRYDAVVTAHSDSRYGLLSRGVRAGRRIGFNTKLSRPNPINHRNRVHEYWRLLGGGDADPIDVPRMMRSLGECLDKASPHGEIPGLRSQYVMLAPGGAKNILRDDALRRWPIGMYRTLADRLILDGRQVLLVGAESDRWVSKSFDGVAVIDLIGKTSLANVIRLAAAASVVVTNDSGILHLSTITGAGIVALFGPTPSNAVIPYGRERTIVIEEGNRVSCSPCYDGINYAPCTRPVCLEAISVQRVFDAVRSLIAQSAKA